MLGVAFSKVLYLIEDLCDWAVARTGVGTARQSAVWLWVRCCSRCRRCTASDTPCSESAISGHFVVGMLLVLMVGKMVATSLTIGIGGSGGVFAPTLFIGAMGGTAFGATVHHWWPAGVTESPGAYGLIGMGAVLGAATRAPITAVVILFELTGEYSIILPLMAAVAMAAGTGRLLSKTTIYTAKLWRRGVDLGGDGADLRAFTAGDIVGPAPPPLSMNAQLATAATHLRGSAVGIAPCVDESGQYVGCVSVQKLAEAFNRAEPPSTIAELVEVAADAATAGDRR